MRKLLNFVLTEFLYNGHLQSLGSVGIVYLSCFFLLSISAPFEFLLIIYLVFETIFLHDRYKDLKKDEATNSVRAKHIALYKRYVPYILFGSYIVLFVLLFLFANAISAFILVFFLVMGLLYPIYFKGLTKYIYFFKNFYVGGVYGALVFVPFFYFHSNVPLSSGIVFSLMVFVEAFLGQVILDTKDEKSDKKEGLLTFVSVFGFRNTLLAVLFFSILYFLIFSALSYFYLSLLTFFLNIYIVRAVSQGKKSGYFAAAGQFLIWLCFALAINIIIV